MTVASLEELELLIAPGTLSASLHEKVNMLSVTASCPLPAEMLRAALLALPNLSQLIITSPCSNPATIFDDVTLGRLVLFNTKLPHSAITHFIASTPSIRSLTLGCCGSEEVRREPCAMRTLDLKSICQLSGPLECISGMMPYNSDALRTVTLEKCLGTICARPIPPFTLPRCMSLTTLTVSFALDDTGFMDTIVRSAPFLTTLRLFEFYKPTVTFLYYFHSPYANCSCAQRRVSPSRRLWNNFPAWARFLHQLSSLKLLTVMTAASMVSRGGSLSQERELVFRWLTGRRRGGQAHPSLCQIGLLYAKKGSRPGSGFLSAWERRADGWSRIKHSASVIPSDSTFF